MRMLKLASPIWIQLKSSRCKIIICTLKLSLLFMLPLYFLLKCLISPSILLISIHILVINLNKLFWGSCFTLEKANFFLSFNFSLLWPKKTYNPPLSGEHYFICLGAIIITGTLPLGVSPVSISYTGYRGRHIFLVLSHSLYQPRDLENSLTCWDSPRKVLWEW